MKKMQTIFLTSLLFTATSAFAQIDSSRIILFEDTAQFNTIEDGEELYALIDKEIL